MTVARQVDDFVSVENINRGSSNLHVRDATRLLFGATTATGS
jgi:hypothetical protein